MILRPALVILASCAVPSFSAGAAGAAIACVLVGSILEEQQRRVSLVAQGLVGGGGAFATQEVDGHCEGGFRLVLHISYFAPHPSS